MCVAHDCHSNENFSTNNLISHEVLREEIILTQTCTLNISIDLKQFKKNQITFTPSYQASKSHVQKIIKIILWSFINKKKIVIKF